MIKGISYLRPVAGSENAGKVASFLAALGFAAGKDWDESGVRGTARLAPQGNLTLTTGEVKDVADLMVEVSSLDAAFQAAERWLQGEGGDEGLKRLAPITETSWKARIFTVEPVAGFAMSFWAWTDPVAGKPLAVEGDLSAEGMRFAIVVARWNAVITDRLLEGSLDCLLRSGVRREDIEIVRVPGAWEVPAAARTIACRESGPKVDAIINLGCLLRGETAHYEAIYNEVSRGIGDLQLTTGIPMGFGVLTCETLEQALNRAGIKAGNKGFEAASAAIEMVSLNRKLTGKGGQA